MHCNEMKQEPLPSTVTRRARREPACLGTPAKAFAVEGVTPESHREGVPGAVERPWEGSYASVTYLSASGSMGTGYSPVKQAVQ